jgi:hypothetical protein
MYEALNESSLHKRRTEPSNKARDQNYELVLLPGGRVRCGDLVANVEDQPLLLELSGRMMLSKATVRASPAVPADLKGALLLRCARASNFAKTRTMEAARCRAGGGLVRARRSLYLCRFRMVGGAPVCRRLSMKAKGPWSRVSQQE